jgi:hypothetical protein
MSRPVADSPSRLANGELPIPRPTATCSGRTSEMEISFTARRTDGPCAFACDRQYEAIVDEVMQAMRTTFPERGPDQIPRLDGRVGRRPDLSSGHRSSVSSTRGGPKASADNHARAVAAQTYLDVSRGLCARARPFRRLSLTQPLPYPSTERPGRGVLLRPLLLQQLVGGDPPALHRALQAFGNSDDAVESPQPVDLTPRQHRDS